MTLQSEYLEMFFLLPLPKLLGFSFFQFSNSGCRQALFYWKLSMLYYQCQLLLGSSNCWIGDGENGDGRLCEYGVVPLSKIYVCGRRIWQTSTLGWRTWFLWLFICLYVLWEDMKRKMVVELKNIGYRCVMTVRVVSNECTMHGERINGYDWSWIECVLCNLKVM